MKNTRITSAIVAAIIATTIIATPAHANDSDSFGGSSSGAFIILETSQTTTSTNQKHAENTKKTYDSGVAREARDKATPTKRYDGKEINPRGYRLASIASKTWATSCVRQNGSLIRTHGGCYWNEINLWGYREVDYVDYYTVQLPTLTVDLVSKKETTRATSNHKVDGNPGVQCEPTSTQNINGITQTNTLRTMSYVVKGLNFDRRHDQVYKGGTRRAETWADAQWLVDFWNSGVSHSYNVALKNTAEMKSSGYYWSTEEPASKRLIGCYYNRKMEARASTWFGAAQCVVDYTVNVTNRRTGKQVATDSGTTPYKANPTVETCKGGLYAKINVNDLVPNEYGVFTYRRTFTHDNPKVTYDAGKGWSLESPLTNTTKQTKTLYVRNTCNPAWNGVFTSPPSDVVTKNGQPWKLTYTEDDCRGLPDAPTCAAAPQGNQTPSVLAGDTSPYLDDNKVFTNTGKIIINRDGEPRTLTMTVPNIGVNTGYSNKVNGEVPRNLEVASTGMAKNVAGTPWASNAQARKGLSENTAHLADFTMRDKSGDWISHITRDPDLDSITNGEYYSYRFGSGLVKDVDIASRWESQEGKPTLIRSDFTIKGEFPAQKTMIKTLGPNGVKEESGNSIMFVPSSMRCVSGPTEVETLRPVS